MQSFVKNSENSRREYSILLNQTKIDNDQLQNEKKEFEVNKKLTKISYNTI